MSYQFKVGDKGRTKCGNSYEVLATASLNGTEHVVCKISGYYNDYTAIRPANDASMLTPPTQSRTVWLNVYRDETCIHESESDAIYCGGKNALAVAVPVTFEYTPKG